MVKILLDIDLIRIKKSAVVDHDHISGYIRGIICNKCNTLLGMCNDNISILENAADYLLSFKKKLKKDKK